MRKPIATTLSRSSVLKMPRKAQSNRSRTSCFHVPGASSGDDHASVPQLTRIVARMSQSNHGSSISLMAAFRGWWPGSKQNMEVLR